MRAEVEGMRCDGTGFCVELVPRVFALDDGAPPSRALDEDLDGEEAELAREAADMCPTRAIVLRG